MKFLILSLFCFLLFESIKCGSYKRGVFTLYEITEQVTGMQPLKFLSYGCFCGLGGKGTPVDAIDKCCKAHDECYSNVQKGFCIPYVIPYDFNAVIGHATCTDTDGTCSYNVCNCDKVLTECFYANRNSWSPNYVYSGEQKDNC